MVFDLSGPNLHWSDATRLRANNDVSKRVFDISILDNSLLFLSSDVIFVFVFCTKIPIIIDFYPKPSVKNRDINFLQYCLFTGRHFETMTDKNLQFLHTLYVCGNAEGTKTLKAKLRLFAKKPSLRFAI